MTKEILIKSAIKLLVNEQVKQGSWGYALEEDSAYEVSWKDVLNWLEQQPNEDCRNCKKWDECPCGKGGHENETSMGYSIGECKDYEPSDDCISRADTLDAIETYPKFGVNAEQKLVRWQDHYVPYVHLDDVRNAVANMPSVTPQPKMGKWIKAGEWSEGFGMGEVYGWFYECSECDKQVKGEYCECSYNYCPNCGADMTESEE